jgi:plasmid stability protein
MSTERITLRISDSFKKKLEARAAVHNKSVNQTIYELLTVGSLMDELVDEDSKVVVRHAKGFKPDQEVIVPIQQLL